MAKKPKTKVTTRFKQEPQRTFIRAWREQRNKTQAQLAEATGVRPATVSRIETGKRQYTQLFLEAAAEYLETDPASLLMRDPSDPDLIWSIWDKVSAADKPQALSILETYVKKRRA